MCIRDSQCHVEGQRQLPAVGVAGDDEAGPVAGHRVEHPLVRRVQHAHRQVGRRIGRPRDPGLPVQLLSLIHI